jgi:hypothetical protein
MAANGPNLARFQCRMSTLPYRPIIVSAECLIEASTLPRSSRQHVNESCRCQGAAIPERRGGACADRLTADGSADRDAEIIGGNSSDAAPHQSSARQMTTYSNAAIASTTAARIGPASATSGRSCALTAPTHCPMITNLRIWPRTSTRNLCVRNFIQSHHRSKICTAADRTEVPRLTCDYPRTRTGIPTADRSMTLETVTSIITTECNFRGGIT